MNPDIEYILLTREQVTAKVSELAAAITQDYQGKTPVLIGVLKGSFIFLADLVRHIDLPCEIDFLAVSSYGKKSETSGAVRILKDLDDHIEGRDVIVVEDILDSGVTLSYIMNVMKNSRPASLSICTLLDKPERRQAPVQARYVGFQTPDEFLVGYGLDYAGMYRCLPYIGVLKREIYE